MSRNTASTGSHDPQDAGSSAVVLITYLFYAIGAPLLAASSSFNLSMESKDSRSLVVVSLGLPILFCGWATYTIAKRLGKRIAFGAIGGSGMGQLVGFLVGVSYLAPLVGALVGAVGGTVVALIAFGAGHRNDQSEEAR